MEEKRCMYTHTLLNVRYAFCAKLLFEVNQNNEIHFNIGKNKIKRCELKIKNLEIPFLCTYYLRQNYNYVIEEFFK